MQSVVRRNLGNAQGTANPLLQGFRTEFASLTRRPSRGPAMIEVCDLAQPPRVRLAEIPDHSRELLEMAKNIPWRDTMAEAAACYPDQGRQNLSFEAEIFAILRRSPMLLETSNVLSFSAAARAAGTAIAYTARH
jgi:hypothetical protein